MNHLIEGAKLAIANGPGLCQNVMSNNEVKLWTQEFTIAMQEVSRQYKNGATIFTRPLIQFKNGKMITY